MRPRPDNPTILTSYIHDGSMSKGVGITERDANRSKFLERNHISLQQTVLVHLTYESKIFTRYKVIDSSNAGDGIITRPIYEADALFTKDKNIALFLPIADCIALVAYDPKAEVLGLSHLGRHNLIQNGGYESIAYMQKEFGADVSNLEVWLSPAAGGHAYPLYDLNNKSLHEVAVAQLFEAGIDKRNIVIDTRDTTDDQTLFSHSEFLKGNQTIDGRQAVVAMMRL